MLNLFKVWKIETNHWYEKRIFEIRRYMCSCMCGFVFIMIVIDDLIFEIHCVYMLWMISRILFARIVSQAWRKNFIGTQINQLL